MSDLKKTLERVILNVGDIVVDCINQDIGILTRRVRKFDFLLEELYIWEVRWINKIKEEYRAKIKEIDQKDIEMFYKIFYKHRQNLIDHKKYIKDINEETRGN